MLVRQREIRTIVRDIGISTLEDRGGIFHRLFHRAVSVVGLRVSVDGGLNKFGVRDGKSCGHDGSGREDAAGSRKEDDVNCPGQ
jgi:hypothetical protein